MKQLIIDVEKPCLLVSVRNAAEALAALDGGADVIDVKEPNRGPLGAAETSTISDVVRVVNGRAPVTAAMGELLDLIDSQNGNGRRLIPNGVSLFKIGLAGCARLADWQTCWHCAIDSLTSLSSGASARPVGVAYADWRGAQSPSPPDVLSVAIKFCCSFLLIDTWNKTGGSLFDHWPTTDLRNFLAEARSHNIAVVLAGSLQGESVAAAVQLAPNLIAVRTAACEAGRGGTVSAQRVRDLKQAIDAAARTPATA